jgi:chromosome segregation ATPase
MISIAYDLLKKERDVLKARVAELEGQILGVRPNISEMLELFKNLDVSKDRIKKLEADLEYYKRELTDRSNALEATKQDWHEARKTITKLEADKALAIKFIKTISKTKEGIRYWCDNSAHTQYSSMHSDAHTTCKECGASEDGPGEQIYSSVLTRDAELAVEALKKLEAAE